MTSEPDNKGMTDAEEDEIESLEGREWKTLNSATQENFKSLLKNPETADKFDEAYATSVGERWRELTKFYHKLFFVVFPLVIIIGVLNSGFIREITFLGFKISRDSGALEVFLLLASLLSVIRSLVHLLEQHYGAIVESYVDSKSDSRTKDYYLLSFGWTAGNYWTRVRNKESHLTAPIVTTFLAYGLALGLMLIGAVLLILEFFILLDAMITVCRDPILPLSINVPIVVIASSALLCRIFLELLALPLPYSDYSNLYKLDIAQHDPTRSEKIRIGLGVASLKRERRNVRLLQMVAMLGTMVTLYLVDVGTGFYTDYWILSDFVLASTSFLFFIFPFLEQLEKSAITASIRTEDSDLRLARYIMTKKWGLRLRVLLSVLYGLISFVWLHIKPLIC